MRQLFVIIIASLSVSHAIAADIFRNDGISASGAELDDILTVLVATNSPFGDLTGSPRSELQVSLPPATSPVRLQVGNTTLLPFDSERGGLLLAVRIESHSDNKITIRADVTFSDPIRGFANVGAAWKLLIFELSEGHWKLTEDLGGAQK